MNASMRKHLAQVYRSSSLHLPLALNCSPRRTACFDYDICSLTGSGNFELLGIPPVDLLEEVVAAWEQAGLNAIELLQRSCEITREFTYEPSFPTLRERLRPRFISNRMVPVKNRTLKEVP